MPYCRLRKIYVVVADEYLHLYFVTVLDGSATTLDVKALSGCRFMRQS